MFARWSSTRARSRRIASSPTSTPCSTRKKECDAVYHKLARRKDLDYILAFAWCQNTCQLWDPGEARKVLTGFLAEDPSDRFSRLALAASYQLTNEQGEAEKALGDLPDSDPDAPALRILLGEICESMTRFEEARAWYRLAIGRDPLDQQAHKGLTRVEKRLGDSENRAARPIPLP